MDAASSPTSSGISVALARDLQDFITHRSSPGSGAYDDLKAKHFLTDDDGSVPWTFSS